MRLLGLALGVIAYAKPLLGVQESRQKRRKSQTRPVAVRRRSRELVLTPAESVERTQELVLRGRARTRARSRSLNPSRPLFPAQTAAEGMSSRPPTDAPVPSWRATKPPHSQPLHADGDAADDDTIPRVRAVIPQPGESPLPWERG